MHSKALAHKLLHWLAESGVTKVDVFASMPLPHVMKSEDARRVHSADNLAASLEAVAAPSPAAGGEQTGEEKAMIIPPSVAVMDAVVASLLHISNVLALPLSVHAVHGPVMRDLGQRRSISLTQTDRAACSALASAVAKLTGALMTKEDESETERAAIRALLLRRAESVDTGAAAMGTEKGVAALIEGTTADRNSALYM